MKRKQLGFTGPVRAILGALALVVLFAFGTPQAANASTAANTTISNTVTVDFQNTSGVAQTPVTQSVDIQCPIGCVNPRAQPTGRPIHSLRHR